MSTSEEKYEWINMDVEDIEDLVVDLKEEGYSTSEIGMVLRDKYAVPDVREVTGKKISQILTENDVDPKVPEDLRNLVIKAKKLREHQKENPNDKSSKRGLQITESKVHQLAKYYRDKGKIPEDWKYKPEEADLLISE
ncbi:30S ribosomal protein S15 [Methanonatronarchaeum sp. AMET6-2]|uniref:30S ribosomal protein S15 n=1 Tax=Methanonatronarchaeum sp. AMET6-2 TaxID=2933293 RepID=UPI0011F8CCEB|nr:30S ribosomal protein S15 [Methanonatronarchaeum sp. AMET6-2]RZN60831.1 MAG: 30S ribosomal protein S15 [Methanonatronarchaeia archaeon]UOY09526.1 30S ribosomal protein S15 [Methanonatronarchaeum sp. AMET6-2]